MHKHVKMGIQASGEGTQAQLLAAELDPVHISVGAVALEDVRRVHTSHNGMHDEWQAGDRRYLSEGSMARLYPERDTELIAELNSGD